MAGPRQSGRCLQHPAPAVVRVDKRGGSTQCERVTADEKGFRAATVARMASRTLPMLAKRLWLWPLVGAVVIGLVGYWVRSRVEGTTRAELVSRLQTVLNADITALRLWFTEREYDAKSFASDIQVRAAIEEIAALASDTNVPTRTLVNCPAAKTLQIHLQDLLEAQNYLDYVVVSPDKRIIASPYPRVVNIHTPRSYDLFLNRALEGELAASRPFAREATLSQRAEGPTMFVAAPVKSTNGTIIAVLGLRMKPEKEFTQIFSVAHMGETGEAYAFDRRGMMLTATRFDPTLKTLGLIPPGRENTAILNLKLLDPGAELLPGESPSRPRSELGLTRMALAATTGYDGCDVDGYRNYRGIEVVGAWAWLREYGMGVATEVAVQEAFNNLYVLRGVFMVLFLLLVLSGGAIFVFTLLVDRLQATARKSALAARRLGQYVLVQEIGRGANGMVYRARHSLLRRPVAIKLLSPDMTNEDNTARFEHEVQMTSQLTHPNTVAIYDYGHTPEGIFYYAMEFLGGIDLDQLVRQFGAQPEGRVVHILRQVCGSLSEAHRIGLIHRDIKPANIILTRRGGVCDLVKVLDFGLVKTARQRPGEKSGRDAVVGTPHFISPEAVAKPESVDMRTDLYSLGAVGYWLLTGKTLFEQDTIEGLLEDHVKRAPLHPADRLQRPVSQDLAEVLLRCLAKRPEERPASAEELDQALAACGAAGTWTGQDAEKWWKSNMGSFEPLPTTTMAEKTLVIAPRP
jgi:eukaryotic-like serine/threonine-protein kinase